MINFLQGHCFLIINYLLCSVCSVDTLLTVLLNVNKNNYVTAVRMRRGAAFCISLRPSYVTEAKSRNLYIVLDITGYEAEAESYIT